MAGPTVQAGCDTLAQGSELLGAGGGDLVLIPRQQVSHASERRRLELLVNKRDRWINRLQIHLADVRWYATALDRWTPGSQYTRERLELEAARARRRAQYAERRVQSLSRPLGPRAAKCGTGERWIRCGCADGAAQSIPAGCNVRGVCAECDRRRARRLRRRLAPVVAYHQDEARRARRSARLRMITLTIRHSGDLARDRAELVRGWQQLRKQLTRWWGGMPPFVLCWETTAGRDGMGHEHAHVLVIGGPGRWNYAAMRRVWIRACPRSASLQIDTVRGNTAKRAAYYVSKYVSKGVNPSGWSDELVAQWLAAHYGARQVATSRGFWVFHVERKPCPHCGELHRVADRPSPWELMRRGLVATVADRWLAEGSHAFHVEREPG